MFLNCTRVQRYTFMIFRIILGAVSIYTAFLSIRLAISLQALALGASSIEVGVLVSLISLGPAFAAVSFGRWIDRVGTKPPVITGVALLVAAAIVGILPNHDHKFLSLYVIALIAGLGILFITMLAQKTVGFLSAPENRQASFAWLAMGMSGAGLVSPILTGYIIDLNGYQAVYAAALIFCLIGLLVFAISFKLLPTSLTPGKQKKKQATSSWDLIAAPRLRSVLIVSGLVSASWDLQHFMFPVYGHAVGLSATEIGWLTGTFYSATFLVRFLMPWTSRHFSEWQFLTLTLAIGGASYAMFPLFTSFEALLVAAFILGIGLGSSQPNVMSLLHSEAPADRVGEALGMRTMLTKACHAVIPSVFGALTAALGATSIFAAMAGILSAAAIASSRHGKEK